jgi:FkbM family methyltransferase
MTNYYDERFLKHLDIPNIKTIFEVGSRYGDESLTLSRLFRHSIVYSFECNPLTIPTCIKNNLSHKQNIKFIPYGLGDSNESRPFYAYVLDNDGASSLYKRIDYDQSQRDVGNVTIKKLSDFVQENSIDTIDLLCMDVQGYELNVLKGADDFIHRIKYVILEEPKAQINTRFLPENVYSKYINAPSSQEISAFMTKNNFTEIVRLQENDIEDNVMYRNTLF